MTQDRFAGRLDAATYENDDEVVGVFEQTTEDTDALWLSGQLFHRLTTVASAYRLHLLPMLGGSEPMRLNGPQCQSLLDELAFVAERLNDPLATATAQAISDFVVIRTRQPAWKGSITIEGDSGASLLMPGCARPQPTANRNRCDSAVPKRPTPGDGSHPRL